MKKIIALLLVLMLTMTIFVACTNDPEPENPSTDPGTTDQTPGGENPGDEEPEEIVHDNVGGLENTNQHDGAGTELPIVPIQ